MYATIEHYMTEYGGEIPAESVKKYLLYASEKVDTATFNRIVKIGFDNLTEYQKSKVQLATCMIADKLYSHDSDPLSATSYSVGDISVSVGTDSAESSIDGIPSIAMELLYKTGLACRLLY